MSRGVEGVSLAVAAAGDEGREEDIERRPDVVTVVARAESVL